MEFTSNWYWWCSCKSETEFEL